jgi:glycosyltransferase involved in cell wall biosynthesis
MLNILVVNWRDIENPEAGGAEVHLHEIFKRIAAMGHHVTLLASGFGGAPAEETIDGIGVVRRGGKFTFNFHVPGALSALQKRRDYDVIVDDVNKIPFFTPVYVRKPVLALAHHLFAETIFLETFFPLATYVYLSEWLIPLFYRNTRFVVVSQSTKDEFVKRGLSGDRIGIVYNAVDHGVYKPDFKAKSKTPLIGYVGRIKKYKCIEHLLEASRIVFAKLPDARLVVAGSGDHLDSLKKTATAMGIADRTEFIGHVGETEKVEMLRQVHVVANPSSKEGWGVTVIESNACGTPVVASNVPGLRDAVVDGETGFLVPHGDVAALAEKVLVILEDRDLRRAMSDKAVEWSEKFSWDESAAAIVREMEALLDETPTQAPSSGAG